MTFPFIHGGPKVCPVLRCLFAGSLGHAFLPALLVPVLVKWNFHMSLNGNSSPIAKSYAPENVQRSTFNVCSCTLAFPPFWFGVIILYANSLLYCLIGHYKSSSCLYLCLPPKTLCYLKEVTLAFSLISSHNVLFFRIPMKMVFGSLS